MKRLQNLKAKAKAKRLTKYPNGGTAPTDPPTGTPAPTTTQPGAVSEKATVETKNFSNIAPFSWSNWDTVLSQFPQGYNSTQGGRNPTAVNTTYYYVGQTIVPEIKKRQEVLNAAYAKQYGKTYDPKNPSSFQPTEDQYLTPEQSNKALQDAGLGTYDEYLQYSNAYNAYRAKTQIAGTNTQGTQEDPNAPQNYGVRHYNLFTPGYTVQPTTQPQQNQQSTQPLPQQALGGRFGDVLGDIGKMNWGDAGDLAANYAKGTADTALGMVGASNVIQDSAYKGAGAGISKDWSNTAGQIGKVILPAALQAVGVPMGVTKAAQSAIGQFNPEEEQQMNYGGVINSNNPNAELEKKEVFQTPNGQVNQVNGPSHANGGVAVNLPEGTKIWSDRLRMKGKTFAKHAAAYKTDKEEKILNNSSSSKAQKHSAMMNMQSKHMKLDELFEMQERMKVNQQTDDMYKCGGMVKKMANGGIYIKPANRGKFTAAAKRANMGVQEYADHILANKENYSSTLVKRANFAHVFGGRNYQNGGLFEGQELDLSQDQINHLRSLGYDFETI